MRPRRNFMETNWAKMNMFQPMTRLREWANMSPSHPEFYADIEQVQADALHVADRHDLLEKINKDAQKHIWYQIGSEGNGNLDISWQERAEQMEKRLYWLVNEFHGSEWSYFWTT